MSSPRSHPRRLVPLLVAALVLTVLSGPLPIGDGSAVPEGPGVGLAPTPRVPSAPSAPAAAPPDPDVAVPVDVGADAPLQIRYRIEVRSDDPALSDALTMIPAVLQDPRGWQQADIDFVLDSGAPFTVMLAEGPEAQELCRPYDVGGQFSCQNGPFVVLNAIRWREGVEHWPGDLASYRTMLINHEVGHLLGMHHLRCAGTGQVAPVMEQQSGTLRGCQANAWPTAVELRLAATHQFAIAPAPLDVPFPP